MPSADNNNTMLATNVSDIWTNGTLEDTQLWRTRLEKIYQISLMVLLILVMVAMGCTITVKEVWAHLKRPVGLAIGAVGQFILLPLLAFGLAQALSLATWEAIGTLIISTCPGGAISNVFAYWADGDMSLSVAMTTMSTLLSFGMMPFNLWLYCRFWTSDQAVIPYVNIVITLVSIMAPVLLGMLIRWKRPAAAKIITKIGSVGGTVLIILAIITQLVLFSGKQTPNWRVAVGSSVLPIVAFSASYLVAFLCRRPAVLCRTIGIETGCQNAPMAISIGTLSFPAELSGAVSLPALIYAVTMSCEGYVACGVYRLVKKLRQKKRGSGDLATIPEVVPLRRQDDEESPAKEFSRDGDSQDPSQ